MTVRKRRLNASVSTRQLLGGQTSCTRPDRRAASVASTNGPVRSCSSLLARDAEDSGAARVSRAGMPGR
jgi:hypothetical protein